MSVLFFGFPVAPLLAQLSRSGGTAPQPVDSADPLSQMIDIVGPVELPPWWKTPVGITALSIAAVVLLTLVVVLWRRARARAVVPPPLPREKAIMALGEARNQLGTLSPDDFVALISGILRSYISDQFGLHAREQTSQEFLESISQSSRFNQGEQQLLAEFLRSCDLIKFAAEPAGVPECARLLDEAVQFVNQSQTPVDLSRPMSRV